MPLGISHGWLARLFARHVRDETVWTVRATDGLPPGRRLIATSFCVTCGNRLADLRHTLPRNLDRLAAGEEVVLLDYNSADGLRDWVRNNFARDIGAGRLRYYGERSAPRFVMAHAKNVAHLLGHGRVLVNLDADNFLLPDYLERLRGHDFAVAPVLRPRISSGGFMGRIAVDRRAFRQFGGYDERMVHGYGYDDLDLCRRLSKGGVRFAEVPLDSRCCIPTPDYLREQAQRVPGTPKRESNRRHMAMSVDAIRNRDYVANRTTGWGVACLYDLDGGCVGFTGRLTRHEIPTSET